MSVRPVPLMFSPFNKICPIRGLARILLAALFCFALCAGCALARVAAKEGHIKTVFLILMENKAWNEIKGSMDAPYLNDVVLPQSSFAEQYRGPRGGRLHPSLPNYIWLEAGDNLGVSGSSAPDSYRLNSRKHLVALLERAGISWKSYQEGIPGDSCPLDNADGYAVRHNPMVYFDDVTDGGDPKSAHCIERVRPLTELERDLKRGATARYNFITPDLCNGMHNACSPLGNKIKQGDEWLKAWIPRIKNSSAYRQGGVIFILWDEAHATPSCPDADCPIGLIVLSPRAKGNGYSNSIAYDHSSTLKTIQKIFGVTPLLGAAADPQTSDLSDLFKNFP